MLTTWIRGMKIEGKPAGAFSFTDKMVKYQEQDINREHAAGNGQKKKKQGTQLTCRTATSYLSSWELRMQNENKGIWKSETLQQKGSSVSAKHPLQCSHMHYT
ncbi:Hypothetical predicted protein [Podarcis lilfordi]|uniref:Uncharacterized protein n=1 Tax=Podarcis lilfordi TaxID=74358 RepID=A0AA35KY34_9SAUR|nr:Hypothetical predicted protein [Podarcis lilfordi]